MQMAQYTVSFMTLSIIPRPHMIEVGNIRRRIHEYF